MAKKKRFKFETLFKFLVFFPGPKYMIWVTIWKVETICSLTLMKSFLYLLYSWRYSGFTETHQISLFHLKIKCFSIINE